MFKQQIQGVINLSFPLIIIYNLQPAFFVTIYGQILCSLALGAYVYYLNYKQVEQLEKTLQFSPTGDHKDFFNNIIEACQIDPATVVVKYAYTNESIAMAAGTTVIIDPVVWHDVQDDAQAVKVQEIFKLHVEPNLSQLQKDRLTAFHRVLTPAAQRFIFKHELGHIVHHFSFYKLIVVFITGSLAAFAGIMAAVATLQIHGMLAIIVGMVVGGCMDLFLTYLSNLVWKLQQEKAADLFAVQYSSDEDIQAAALFFENHQNILDTHPEQNNVLAKLPSIIKTGHQHGEVRSAYLLKLMSVRKN